MTSLDRAFLSHQRSSHLVWSTLLISRSPVVHITVSDNARPTKSRLSSCPILMWWLNCMLYDTLTVGTVGWSRWARTWPCHVNRRHSHCLLNWASWSQLNWDNLWGRPHYVPHRLLLSRSNARTPRSYDITKLLRLLVWLSNNYLSYVTLVRLLNKLNLTSRRL